MNGGRLILQWRPPLRQGLRRGGGCLTDLDLMPCRARQHPALPRAGNRRPALLALTIYCPRQRPSRPRAGNRPTGGLLILLLGARQCPALLASTICRARRRAHPSTIVGPIPSNEPG